jgi:hypothetical protein
MTSEDKKALTEAVAEGVTRALVALKIVEEDHYVGDRLLGRFKPDPDLATARPVIAPAWPKAADGIPSNSLTHKGRARKQKK